MKVVRYIILTVLMLSAFSCADIDLQPEPVIRPGLIQIIPRVISFNNAIDTKSDPELIGKENAETDLTCMALVIFDNNGKCIDFQFKEGNDMSFIIDRKVLARADDDDQTNNVAIDNASIYAFANIPSFKDITDWSGKEIGYFDAIEINVTGVTIPTSGLPMRGVYYGKEDADKNPLPYVDLDPEKAIASPLMTIDMYSAYAKVFVSLSVDAAEFETLGFISSFTPTSWQVFNVPKTVDFVSDTNSDTDVTDAFSASTRFEGITAIGTDKISFTFYLPERYLRGGNSDYYRYPFAGDDGSIRDEDLGLRQKYKKEHLTEGQKATYVRLSGTFSDYQGHKKRMEYDLYVGGNEYDDFNIKRNVLYTNNVVIRATKQSNGDADNDGEIDDPDFMNTVSYDGRVNIDESAFIVKLERETVLDSHWEIRPMRISVLSGTVTVSIENPSATPWIRMENSTAVESPESDKSLYLGNTEPGDTRHGKRKYFTTDLLDQLNENTTYTFGPGEHCVWIYVDENVATTNTMIGNKSIPVGADAIRKAVISISHYDEKGNLLLEPVNYTIAQRQLFPVRYTASDSSRDTIYNIEYHEEYLYNYDATNPYGQTEYEGMRWGLDGDQLSNRYAAFFTQSSGQSWWDDLVNLLVSWLGDEEAYRYDFYLERDNPHTEATTRSPGSGHRFTKEIIDYINLDSKDENDIGALALDKDPASAVEYCYNKNKRNSEGLVDQLHWYLPAIDEMEEIAWAGYGEFDEFHDLYYWSSMPAYMRANITNESSDYGDVYLDDIDRARATKVNYINGVPSAPLQSGLVAGKYSGYVPFTINWFIIIPTGIDVGDFQNTGEDVSFYEPGNHPRSKSNRVRCVYKP